jgi:hypothetical protein
MQVFIAGIMQGSRTDEGIVDQGYRERITAALVTHVPGVEVVDPIVLYPGSVGSTAEQARRALRVYTLLLEAYGEPYPRRRNGRRGRRPKPGRRAPEGLLYATVHKHRRNGRVVRVSTHIIYGRREDLPKALRASRCSRNVNIAFVEWYNGTDRHQNARFAVPDNFRDPADRASHDRNLTGHGLEVDDAERLVDRRAREEDAVRVELDVVLLAQEDVDPLAAWLFSHLGRDLLLDLLRVGRARAAQEFHAGIDVLHGLDEVDHPLLPRGAADEQDVVLGNAEVPARVGGVDGLPLVEVDAVVNDMDLPRIDAEKPDNVVFCFPGNGDDGIG